MIEIYTLKGLEDFINLRESCRINKDNNTWDCTDNILKHKRFCNIDRKYDRGTIGLYNVLENNEMDINFKLISILTYRMFSSGNLILDMINESKNIRQFKKIFTNATKYSNRRIPYQFVPYTKGVNFKYFFIHYIHKNRIKICESILNLKNETLLNSINIIHNSMGFTKKLKFGIYQACLDISKLYPHLIDPNSLPLYGDGSFNALKYILENELQYDDRDELIDSSKTIVDNSLTVLEHGLCEYDKYCKYKLGIKNFNTKASNYKLTV